MRRTPRLPRGLEHRHRPHHVDAGAQHRVRAAEGHLQGGEMEDRAHPVLRHRPVHGLGVGDVAFDPGHLRKLLLRHQEPRPAAAVSRSKETAGTPARTRIASAQLPMHPLEPVTSTGRSKSSCGR